MNQTENNFRILIVDDSAPIRNVLRALLESEGYEVVGELGSGAKLIAAIEQLRPHIICLDYQLPDTDGLHLLHDIHAAYPQVAVVMITGTQGLALASAAAEAGAAGFIHKPFSQEQIVEMLRQVVHAQQLLLVAARKRNVFEGKAYRAKAVIADDSSTIRRLLTAILSHMGVEVVGEACDGRQAVELVSMHKPDIICLDFEMPVMNGLEALKFIQGENPGAKVIMITSVASREVIEQARQGGARGYILKPFHPDRVTQAISHLLEG